MYQTRGKIVKISNVFYVQNSTFFQTKISIFNCRKKINSIKRFLKYRYGMEFVSVQIHSAFIFN